MQSEKSGKTMGKFKRFIARLFNIQPEDLPQQLGVQKQTDQVVLYTREEINQIIQQQVVQVMKGYILPEVQGAVEQQVSSQLKEFREEIQKLGVPTQKIEPAVEQSQEPSVLAAGQPDLTITEQLDEEFPVLEEEGPTALDVETFEPPVEESRQVEEEAFPLVEDILPIFEEESTPLSDLGMEQPELASIEGKQIRLGIDFGTTTTAVSIKFGDDLPVALPIGRDGITTYIPSVVYFAPGTDPLEQRATVGEEAESYNNPSRTIRSIKRCFACIGNECKSDRRYSYCQGDGYIHLEGEEPLEPTYVAQLIVKEVLQRAIHYVRDRWQIDLTEENICFIPVNFGCGAKYDLTRRNIICKIATELGFTDFSIQNVVEEPILAGFAFTRFSKNPIGRSLIYDFGGGTFDAAIIEVDEEGEDRRVTILATSADNWLGGDDIDTVIYKYFLKQIASALPGQSDQTIESSLNANDMGRIRQRAKEAKEFLSENETYDVTFASSLLGLVDLHLDRPTFEKLLQESNLVKDSLNIVLHACRLVCVYDKACEADAVDSQEIVRLTLPQVSSMFDNVVLVGGVTKIPFVRKSLAEIFGEEKITQEKIIEPVSAVAVGGAYEHDPDHFSLVVPPFGYFLTDDRNEKTRDYIIKPFDYYDFNRCWATATVGSFSIPVKVLEDRPNAKLWMERAGEEKPKLLKKWNTLGMGEWVLTISLDGTIGFQRKGQGMAILPVDLPKHPRQQAIIDARKAREEARRREADSSWSFYDDMRSMLVDS
ncbi:MAG: Hsp70 family protein [Chloroflexi bacterium]|nr:Hsp70 family protein [Chloroflexota bacterium]